MIVIVLVVSAEHPDHRILFRKYVSRGAAGKGRAVLEGVGLDVPTIEECYSAHPLNEEEAVQDGLTRWCEGQGIQPPTWITLLEAMEYAGLARHNVQGLKEELGTLFCVYLCVWMHVCSLVHSPYFHSGCIWKGNT